MPRPAFPPTAAARLALPVALLALAALTAPAVARAGVACPGYENILFCGELTSDCKVTANDALVALKMGVGQVAPRLEADLDGSGSVAAGDALRVLKVAVGSLPATLDCANQYAVKATSLGFYNEGGLRINGNYAVGWYPISTEELRDYFVFDLSSIPGTITSALLHLSTTVEGGIFYPSPDPTETYQLFDVATDIGVLTGGTGGTAAFADLADGTVYGTLVADKNIKIVVDVFLNDAGVAHLNTVSGSVALGGAITTLTKGSGNEYLFNGTNLTNTRSLVVTVE